MSHDNHHQDDKEFDGLLAGSNPLVSILLILVIGCGLFAVLKSTAVEPGPEDFDDPTGRSDLTATLTRAAQDKSERVLLFVGDSVMRGSVLREFGYSGNQTPAYWARHLAPKSVAVYDVSLDGLLPCDIEIILEQLQELDQDASIEVVMELSPRFLSAQYADESRRSARPWLARPDRGDQLAEFERNVALSNHRLGLDSVRRQCGDTLRHPERVLLLGPEPRDDGEGLLRVARHFLETNAQSSNPQVQALRRIVDSLNQSGRRSLLFNTPINGEAFGHPRHAEPIVNAQLSLRQLAEGNGLVDSHLHVFRHFDDQSYRSTDFIDHCHLKPDGNRVLASRILASLAIPVIESRPRSETRHVIEKGPEPRNGFGNTARIAECKHAVFLSRDHILMAEPGPESDLLRLVGFAPTSVATLDIPVLNEARIAAIHEWGPGRALVFLDNGRVLDFQLGVGCSQLVAAEDQFPWRDKELVIARRANLFVVHGADCQTVWTLDAATAGTSEHFTVPKTQRIHSLAIDDNGTIFVLSELRGKKEFATSLSAVNLGAFLRGDLRQVRNYFSDEEKLAREAWVAIHQSLGLVQLQPRKDLIPIGGARRIHMMDPANRVIVEAPSYAASVKEPMTTWPIKGTTTLWNVDIRLNVAYALLWPSESGVVIDRRTRPPLQPGHVHAIHPQSGRVFSEWSGYRVYESKEVMRFNWKYGVPPDPTGGSVTAMGFTYPPKRDSTWRVGFVGSSLIGGIWPEDAIGRHKLVTSVSIARAFDREVKKHRGDFPIGMDGVDFSLSRTDLIGMYGAILAADATDLNAVVLCLDRATLGDPLKSGSEGGQTIVERWPAIARDADGLPIIDRIGGFLPRIRLNETKPAAQDRTSVVRSAVEEIIGVCRARKITPIVLDLATIDREPLAQEKPPAYGRPEDLVSLRAAFQDLGVPVHEVKDLLGDSLSSLFPFAYVRDRHFRSHFLNAIGRALGRALTPMAESYAFRFDRNEEEKVAAAEAKVPAPDLTPRIHGPKLGEFAANRFHIYLASTAVLRGTPFTLLADLREAKVEADPWRQALALFGRRGVGEARLGRDVHLELVRFDQYDEYGLGVRGSRSILGRYVIAADSLKQAVTTYQSILADPKAAQPAWLKTP